MLIFFFYLGFLSTNILEVQDCRERGRAFHQLFTTTFNRFTDIHTLAERLLERAHPCTQLAAGLEPGIFGFWAQVANHRATRGWKQNMCLLFVIRFWKQIWIVIKKIMLILNTHAVFKERCCLSYLTCVLIYSFTKCVLKDVLKTAVLETL